MRDTIHFLLDGEPVRITLGPGSPWTPQTTVLNYLRSHPGHRGVKEGCAEGDCGACTVVLADEGPDGALHYRAVDSCLVFLPALDRRLLITIEGLTAAGGALHPVQDAIVRHSGSQCGFCTPGIVMSLFALYHTRGAIGRDAVTDALAGNLCRCTGYRPIVDAGLDACSKPLPDRFTEATGMLLERLRAIPGDDLLLAGEGTTWYRPVTTAAAIAWRAAHPEALIINGATDVALRVTKRHEILGSVLDLSGVAALRSIRTDSDGIFCGAGAAIEDVREAFASAFPALAGMLAVFGSRQIRNMATIGGNLGTGSPIGDALPVLIALGASVHLDGPRGPRTVPVTEFFTGYRTTACGPDELITGVRIPATTPGTVVRSYKVSRRRELDISTVSAAFRLERAADGTVGRIVLAYGGMAATPRTAGAVETFLRGKPWTRSVVEDAMTRLELDLTPLSDVRGSAGYRLTVARNLLLRFWSETVGEGVPV